MNGLFGDPPPRELKQTGATFIRNCWVVGNKSEWMDNNRRFCLHMQSPSAVFRFFSDLPQHTPEMLVHGESSAKRPKTSGLGMILTKVGWSLYGVTSFENSWLIILFWCFVLPSIPNIYICIHTYEYVCVCCATQSINQSIKQASKRAINQSVNQSIIQSVNQSINIYIYIYLHTYTDIHMCIYTIIYIYRGLQGIITISDELGLPGISVWPRNAGRSTSTVPVQVAGGRRWWRPERGGRNGYGSKWKAYGLWNRRWYIYI